MPVAIFAALHDGHFYYGGDLTVTPMAGIDACAGTCRGGGTSWTPEHLMSFMLLQLVADLESNQTSMLLYDKWRNGYVRSTLSRQYITI